MGKAQRNVLPSEQSDEHPIAKQQNDGITYFSYLAQSNLDHATSP